MNHRRVTPIGHSIDRRGVAPRSMRRVVAAVASMTLLAGLLTAVAVSAGAEPAVTSPTALAAATSTPSGYVAGSSTEVVSDRTQFTKTYLNPDGSHTLVSSLLPLNYQDTSGAWQTVSTSVVTDPTVSGGFRSAANSWTARFEPYRRGWSSTRRPGTS